MTRAKTMTLQQRIRAAQQRNERDLLATIAAAERRGEVWWPGSTGVMTMPYWNALARLHSAGRVRWTRRAGVLGYRVVRKRAAR